MTPLNHSALSPFIFAVEFKFMSYPNDSTMKRRILFSMVCAVIAAHAFAQGQGLAGINEATSLMTSYFDPATKLCYAIGAVLGLVGGIKTYGKFSSGDPDTSKTAASWFFACIFLMLKYYDVGEHRFHILYRTNWYFPIRRHPRAFCAPCRQ